MKKILTLGLLVTFALPSWAIDWTQVDNLAKGAEVIVSSKPGEAANITDGNDGSRWQAVTATHDYTDDWVIIDLGENKTFTDIEILWEASHASKYSVYVSQTPFTYEPVTDPEYNKLTSVLGVPTLTDEESTEGNYTASLNFPSQQNARYILIYCDELNNNGRNYGASIFEVKLGNIIGRDEVASLSMDLSNTSLQAGNSTTVTVKALNAASEVLDLSKVTDLTLSCNDPSAVEISKVSDGVYNVICKTPGDYTITSTGQANGTTISTSANVSVTIDWSKETNLAVGKVTTGRWTPDADDTDNKPSNTTDNNISTYYEYNGEYVGGEGWVVIDLGSESEVAVNAVEVYFTGNNGGTFKLGYGSSEAQLPTGDDKWTDDNALDGWVFSSSLNKTTDGYVSHILSAAEKVSTRYIAYRDGSNPQKPKIGEILVSGQVMSEPSVASSIIIEDLPGNLVSGETVDLVYSIKDQYGAEFVPETEPTVNVSGNALIEDGVITVKEKGEFTVTVTYRNLSESASSQIVANRDDYCMTGAVITTDSEIAENPQNAIDGGEDPKSNGGLFTIIPNDTESKGENEHYILAKLSKPYDLDLILLSWEGAYPDVYDVAVGSSEDDLTQPVYTINGKTNAEADRFSGSDMKEVQYIKISTHSNATIYGLKLYEIKAYGIQSEASELSNLTIESDCDYLVAGETVNFEVIATDQFDAPIEAIAEIYVDGNKIEGNTFIPESKGTYAVYAKSGDVKSETVDIHVIAGSNQAINGNDAKVNIDFTATLNGEELSSNPFTQETVFEDTDIPLVITFDSPVDLELLKLKWETACASEYTVSVTREGTRAGENEEIIMTVEGRTHQMGINPTDRIFNDTEATGETMMYGLNAICGNNLSGIKSIKILPIAKTHDWNIRLLGVETHGTESFVSSTGVSFNTSESTSGTVDVINLQGVIVKKGVRIDNALKNLPKGIYIIGGKKIVVK